MPSRYACLSSSGAIPFKKCCILLLCPVYGVYIPARIALRVCVLVRGTSLVRNKWILVYGICEWKYFPPFTRQRRNIKKKILKNIFLCGLWRLVMGSLGDGRTSERQQDSTRVVVGYLSWSDTTTLYGACLISISHPSMKMLQDCLGVIIYLHLSIIWLLASLCHFLLRLSASSASGLPESDLSSSLFVSLVVDAAQNMQQPHVCTPWLIIMIPPVCSKKSRKNICMYGSYLSRLFFRSQLPLVPMLSIQTGAVSTNESSCAHHYSRISIDRSWTSVGCRSVACMHACMLPCIFKQKYVLVPRRDNPEHPSSSLLFSCNLWWMMFSCIYDMLLVPRRNNPKHPSCSLLFSCIYFSCIYDKY